VCLILNITRGFSQSWLKKQITSQSFSSIPKATLLPGVCQKKLSKYNFPLTYW
ncbi:unnamed protein product, partial [Larinioides sclopetarius]